MQRLLQTLQTLWDKGLTWLETPRNPSLAEKPSKTAQFMDRFSVGVIGVVVLLLLFLQLKLGIALALLGVGLSILGFYGFFRGIKKAPFVQSMDQKIRKSRYFIFSSGLVERNGRESETQPKSQSVKAGLVEPIQNKDRRWKGHLVVGSVFWVIGWLWSGGWGLYFTVIGGVNLVFAGIGLWYEWKASRLVSE